VIPDERLSPDEFSFITLGDFPKEFVKGIGRELQNFAVSLILDNEPAGSGVLIEIDGVRGILTAEHVIYNPFGESFDNSPSSKQKLLI
jgi:hypothetical protein